MSEPTDKEVAKSTRSLAYVRRLAAMQEDADNSPVRRLENDLFELMTAAALHGTLHGDNLGAWQRMSEALGSREELKSAIIRFNRQFEYKLRPEWVAAKKTKTERREERRADEFFVKRVLHLDLDRGLLRKAAIIEAGKETTKYAKRTFGRLPGHWATGESYSKLQKLFLELAAAKKSVGYLPAESAAGHMVPSRYSIRDLDSKKGGAGKTRNWRP